MKLADADRKKLLPLLGELAGAVEDMLLSGLTTASEATRQTLNVAFQEASRMRLLRLGSTLRVANEELGRFTRNEPDFSRKRLAFFLNRAWLLSHGLERALRNGDEAEFTRLLGVTTGTPINHLEVVTLGVVKKVIRGAACTFDFRLRAVGPAGPIAAGQRLSWTCVFPIKAGVDIPAEAYLHLPQKQRFKAAEFLDGKVIVLEKAAVALDEFGGGRITLSDSSTVTLDKSFSAWDSFQTWAPAAALERIRGHQVGPFDLEVEMQEEIILDDWQLGESESREDGQTAYAINWNASTFEAIISPGTEGTAQRKVLEELRKRKKRPPLFALMHYERCRLVLQPLSVFGKNGPEHLTLSDDRLDRATLLKALKLV
jgi:hypothetical protein